jgi:thioredoxin-related protein
MGMIALRRGLFSSLALCLFALAPACLAGEPNLPGYDAKADPQIALDRALVQAKASKKKVLVVAGGEWCIWCHYLESFIAKNKDVDDAIHHSFVTVKAYYGEGNKNTAFFSRLPKAVGYPHFWVISSDGKVLHSVNTATLEDGGKSYNKARFLKFIRDLG